MPFNVNKCHVLQVETKNRKCEDEMNGGKFESVQCVKDLAVTIASNLKFSLHSKEAACKADRILGFINKIFFFRNKDIILPPYISLVCRAILVASPLKRYIKLEAVQRRATKMISSLCNKSYKKGLS